MDVSGVSLGEPVAPHAQACRDSGHSLIIASAPQLRSEATAVGKYFKYI